MHLSDQLVLERGAEEPSSAPPEPAAPKEVPLPKWFQWHPKYGSLFVDLDSPRKCVPLYLVLVVIPVRQRIYYLWGAVKYSNMVDDKVYHYPIYHGARQFRAALFRVMGRRQAGRQGWRRQERKLERHGYFRR